MKIKNFYTLFIEELNEDQFLKVHGFLSDLLEIKNSFDFHVIDDMIVVEYLNKKDFEKINGFLNFISA